MRKIIALDIGGTNCRIALINENYAIEKSIIKSTECGSVDVFLSQIKNIVLELGIDKDVVAISVGVPGRIRQDGFIYELPNINISNIPLSEYLSSTFSLPVFVKNDAQLAGLSEAILGTGKNKKRLFFVTISTGIGGALIVDGEIQPIGEEIGHTLIKYKNSHYEMEHLASGTGLIKLAKCNDLEIDKAYQLFELLKNDNIRAVQTYNDWLSILTSFFDFVQKYFTPDVISITGGVMKSSDYFWNDLTNMNKRSNIVKCYFDQDAGLVGAACYGFMKAGK